MRNGLKVAAGFAVPVALAIALSACTISGSVTFFTQTVTGTVINARNSAAYISGASVTLTNTTDTSLTYSGGTTDSSGNWSASNVPSGIYSISVSESGYFFPPVTYALAKGTSTIPNIPGFQLSSTDAANYAVSFILMWDTSANTDLDLQMTYPNADYSDQVNNTTSVFYSPYSTIATGWSNGFGPDNPISGRSVTNYSSNTNPNVVLDTDSKSGGPETITMHGLPFSVASTPTAWPISATAANGLSVISSTLTYDWMGVAELYISAANSKYPIATSSSSTNPIVYVIQTTPDSSGNPVANFLGEYTLPTNTSLPAASVIRINMFVDNQGIIDYQLVPDIRVVPDDSTFRSAVPVNPIVGVRGSKL